MVRGVESGQTIKLKTIVINYLKYRLKLYDESGGYLTSVIPNPCKKGGNPCSCIVPLN